VIEEQLHRMQIRAALQQATSGLAPEIVHAEVQFPQLLLAAGKERAVRPPARAAFRH